MCRLYALHANEPTRVECSLVLAQNALMAQSEDDSEGMVHGHGWGVADYPDGMPVIEKQVWAAFLGEHFAEKAARVYAYTMVAHVRRATVGEPAICGKSHVYHETGAHYRLVEIASEPLTAEAGWKAIPDGNVFTVDSDYQLQFTKLG